MKFRKCMFKPQTNAGVPYPAFFWRIMDVGKETTYRV